MISTHREQKTGIRAFERNKEVGGGTGRVNGEEMISLDTSVGKYPPFMAQS